MLDNHNFSDTDFILSMLLWIDLPGCLLLIMILIALYCLCYCDQEERQREREREEEEDQQVEVQYALGEVQVRAIGQAERDNMLRQFIP